MKQVGLNYRVPGLDRTSRRGRVGMASLIVFFTAAGFAAAFLAMPYTCMRDSRLHTYLLLGFPIYLLLSISGAVLGVIAVAMNRSSYKGWLGLLLNASLLSFFIRIVIAYLNAPRGPGP